MINRLEQVKQRFTKWRSEQVNTDRDEIERYFAEEMYHETATLYLEYEASALQVGQFVISLHNFIEEILNDTELLLASFERQYKSACSFDEPFRSRFLTHIASEMERKFKIPLQQNDEFNATNREVMALYQQISAARDL